MKFDFNLVAQNLSDLEIGLILLAFQGLNSSIYPIRVGARNGRGYGRVKFEMTKIYSLKKDGLKAWTDGLLDSYETDQSPETAGYYALPLLEKKEQDQLIKDAVAQVKNQIEASHV